MMRNHAQSYLALIRLSRACAGGGAGRGYAPRPALLVPLQARAHGHASGAKAGLPDSG